MGTLPPTQMAANDRATIHSTTTTHDRINFLASCDDQYYLLN